MGKREAILIFVTVAALIGCERTRKGWPWRKKDIPVTPPSEISPDTSTEPIEEPAAAENEGERDPGRPQGGQRDVTRVKPVWAELPPVAVNRPIMLENIVPGVAPIAMVERPPLRVRTSRRRRDPEPAVSTPPEPPHPQLPPAEKTSEPDRAVRPGIESPPVPTARQSEQTDRPIPMLPEPEHLPVRPLPVEPPVAPVIPERTAPSDEREAPRPEVVPPPPQHLPPLEPVEYGETKVVAASLIQVNDKFLTVDDILRASSDRLAHLPSNVPLPTFRARVKQIVLEEIGNQIIESLTYEQARTRLNEQQKSVIESRLEGKLRTMIAEIGGSRKKLEAVMSQRGTDLETVLSDMRKQMTVQYFLESRFLPAITISRSMLWEHYAENRADFSQPVKVQMQIIAAPLDKFLPPGSSEPTERERLAAGLRAREVIKSAAAAVKAGEDFGDVARKFSRGIKAASDGIWPMMEAGSFGHKQIEDVAFTLKESQVSDVIETPEGYYIVKARRVQPGRSISFEEAQEQIEAELRQEQLRNLEQDYFRRLRERSHVRQSEKFLDLAVERAVETYWQR